MSNANLLADLDGFYRASDNGPAQTQQRQASQATQPQPQAQLQSSADPFGFGSVSQASQGAPPPTSGSVFGEDDDDDWGGFETAEPAGLQGQPVPKPFNVAPVTSPVPAPSDPFAGFAVTNPTPTPPANPQTNLPRPPPPSNGQGEAFAVRNRPTRVNTMELVTNSLLDLGIPSEVPAKIISSRQSATTVQEVTRKPRDPNVLFDADDIEEEDEDEFGAFEDVDSWDPAATNVARPTKPAATSASVDLLSMDDAVSAQDSRAPSARERPSSVLMDTDFTPSASIASPVPPSPFQRRNPFPGLSVSTSPKEDVKKNVNTPSASPSTPWPDFDDDPSSAKAAMGEWAPFEEPPSKKPHKAALAPTRRAATTAEEHDNWDWDAVEAPDTSNQPSLLHYTKDDYDDKEPPPTNIPPPSVLMTILPELFSLASSSLLKPTAGQSAAARKELFSDPSTISFLRAYLLIATVAARILAGRKLRWNRDRFLAQGMAISAAGAKGMKLAGVDKAEAGREDREAADVVAAWKGQVGRLRAAVAGANAAIAETGGLPLRVPEIGESMRVSTVKVAPKAPRQCVVCGLKREERVAKVDFEVEDSFGEWWVEHWGHRACRNFWKEHEGSLRSR